MAKRAYSANIAAIMLKDKPSIAIDFLADEILKSSIAQNAGARAVTWDCNDLVFLDFDNLRIALHEIEATDETPSFICLAVGSVPGQMPIEEKDCSHISQEMVKKLTHIVSANAVLWHDDARALCSKVMDDFHDSLGKMLGYLDMMIHDAAEQKPAKTEPNRAQIAAHKKQSVLLKHEAALDTLREHLRATGRVNEPLAPYQHLSMYMIACTFFLTLPAAGSAILSYIWLRNGLDKPSSST